MMRFRPVFLSLAAAGVAFASVAATATAIDAETGVSGTATVSQSADRVEAPPELFPDRPRVFMAYHGMNRLADDSRLDSSGTTCRTISTGCGATTPTSRPTRSHASPARSTPAASWSSPTSGAVGSMSTPTRRSNARTATSSTTAKGSPSTPTTRPAGTARPSPTPAER